MNVSPLIMFAMYKANERLDYVNPSISARLINLGFKCIEDMEARRCFVIQTKAYAQATDSVALRRIMQSFVDCITEQDAHDILVRLTGCSTESDCKDALKQLYFNTGGKQ